MEMTPREFADWAQAAPWTFAKTMPEIPHAYTTRRRHPPEVFDAAVRCIRQHGYQRKWRRYRNTYLAIGQHKYWTMGAPIPATIVLNRAELEDGDRDHQLAATHARQLIPRGVLAQLTRPADR